MFFNSVKEINRFKKEINRLSIKGMSNVYFKVTTEKNWRSQNFNFLSLKNLSPSQFLGKPRLTQISFNFKNSCWNSKIREIWEQNCVWLFYYFNLERNYEVLKSKSSCILLNKNINFNKNETKSKMDNPTTSFRETNFALQPI